MSRKINRSSWKLSLQLLLVLAAALLVWGCGGGGSSYDTPSEVDNAPIAGAATNVLIEAETLKSWIDEGLVGNETGFGTKVVVLDFRSPSGSDRIAGACRVEAADLTATRFEGVADATPLVATGAQMDAVIQRLGIDENTTIVFTTGGSSYMATRAYWTFRYWGFPKERLRLLNGGNAAFAAEYPALMTTAVPTPTPSTYSVRNLLSLNDDLRASIGELIEIFSTDLTNSTTNIVFDARGDSYYLGNNATSGLLGGDVVVVDGHPEGGQFLSQADLFDAGKFRSASEIEALFAAKGWTAGMKATVYCTSGYSATPLFFALDAILGADVQLHDGSWSQTGKYSSNADKGGELPYNSLWAIDRYLDPATYTYNEDVYLGPLTIETLNAAAAVDPQAAPFTGNNAADDSDVVQSQVEAADGSYADGSGATSIAAPVATSTPDVLIDYATLKAWSDADLVNAAAGEKVVILDVTTAADYVAKRHIPGAQLWNTSGQAITRTEGPAPAVNMVLDGASMDARIQAAGIDENTTIVITSSATQTYFPSRAYFLFRYWGFPKERIKVLNGYNNAWPQADLTSVEPSITPSTLSVADLDSGAQLDTRVSLAELMDAVRDARGTAIDMRGDKSAAKSTAGVFSDVANDYVVFEGTVAGGTSFNWMNFNVDYAGGDLTFKSQADIAAAMLAAGIDTTTFSNDGSYSDPVYSYCRTGYIASSGFFVLDAILDIDVMTYDGSWSQWGKMSTVTTNKGGELPDASEWATDSGTYMSVINYNKDYLKQIEPLNADADALLLAPAAANQVEEEDFIYQTTPVEDSGSGSTPPTAGGGDLGGGC